MGLTYRIVDVGILEVVITRYFLDIVRVGLKEIQRKRRRGKVVRIG